MKNILKKLLEILICATVVFSCVLPGIKLFPAFASNPGVSDIDKYIDAALDYEIKKSGADSVQSFIDSALVNGAGTTAEWFVISLKQYKGNYDFSAYTSALKTHIKNKSSVGAVERERYALTFAALKAEASYINETIDESTGNLGIMSYVFGLHLINNGYAGKQWDAQKIISAILSRQLPEGGWAVNGEVSDVDVTAMTLHSIAPYYKSDSAVKSAADKALSLLSGRQLASGGFSSYGAENPESAAQVLCALTALKIDPLSDSRFIKNGKTALDGMLMFRLSDGGFSHVSGGDHNLNASVQAIYSLVALRRFMRNEGPLFIFTSSPAPAEKTTKKPTSAPAKTTTKKATENTSKKNSLKASAALTENTKRTDEKKSAATGKTTEEKTQKKASDNTVRAKEKATQISGENSSETGAEKTKKSADVSSKKIQGSKKIKLWIIGGVWIAAAGLCALLFALKRRSRVNFIVVIIGAAVISALLLFTNIQSPDEFYADTSAANESAVSVTFSISCETIIGKSDKEYIPSDGVILPETQFSMAEGSTVYDCLVFAAKKYGIQFEDNTQTGTNHDNAYIKGINYIYEFDFGELSGWMYKVNGVTASVGCGQYKIKDGDKIEWLYTCSLGDDLK